MQAVPEAYREKYFEGVNTQSVFRNDLRRLVIFGRHDLVQDAPISRLDLLVVRNTLMYLNTETQERILNRLHYALNPKGYLFLGRAEMLIGRNDLFAPVDLKFRIFIKVPGPRISDQYLVPARTANGQNHEASNADKAAHQFQDSAHELLPVACLIVDDSGTLITANLRARTLFRVRMEDFGRPFSDFEASYRPVELRSVIDRVIASGTATQLNIVEWKNPENGKVFYLDVHVMPVIGSAGRAGVAVSFFDMTESHRLQQEIQTTKNELETTNEELHSANEELETTNEELQSTVEELQTTNEEMQSTNEEMETMNEELQATNEELRVRTEELNLANAYKEAIFRGIHTGVIAVDRNYLIRAWNHQAEDLWGIREDEAQGQSFFGLEIGLPVNELRDIIRDLLSGESGGKELVLPSTSRKGKNFHCRVTCTPLLGGGGRVQGAILLMEEWKKQEEIGESFDEKNK